MKIMSTRIVLTFAFVVLIQTESFSQYLKNESSIPNNLFYIEALGNGLYGSINFERRFTRIPEVSIRAGIGAYSENLFYLTFPLSIQYIKNLSEESFIEIGTGYTWADSNADDLFRGDFSSKDSNLHNLFFSVGYRKHFGDSWLWKANITPLITNNRDVTQPWFGVSIGKLF